MFIGCDIFIIGLLLINKLQKAVMMFGDFLEIENFFGRGFFEE